MPLVWSRHARRTDPRRPPGPAPGRNLRRGGVAGTREAAACRSACAPRSGPGTLTLHIAFATRGDIPVVGLAQPFRRSEGLDGPAVWRRFQPLIARIPNRVGAHTLGINEVVDMAAGDLVYAPAVEVSEIGDLPDQAFGPAKPCCKLLEGGRFAIFTFRLAGGDIAAEFRRVYDHIYGIWVPESGTQLRAWYDFEHYGARFDPKTHSGEVSIWVPVR